MYSLTYVPTPYTSRRATLYAARAFSRPATVTAREDMASRPVHPAVRPADGRRDRRAMRKEQRQPDLCRGARPIGVRTGHALRCGQGARADG